MFVLAVYGPALVGLGCFFWCVVEAIKYFRGRRKAVGRILFSFCIFLLCLESYTAFAQNQISRLVLYPAFNKGNTSNEIETYLKNRNLEYRYFSSEICQAEHSTHRGCQGKLPSLEFSLPYRLSMLAGQRKVTLFFDRSNKLEKTEIKVETNL